MAVSQVPLPEPFKCKGRYSQATIVLGVELPREELEKELKELKGFATS